MYKCAIKMAIKIACKRRRLPLAFTSTHREQTLIPLHTNVAYTILYFNSSNFHKRKYLLIASLPGLLCSAVCSIVHSALIVKERSSETKRWGHRGRRRKQKLPRCLWQHEMFLRETMDDKKSFCQINIKTNKKAFQ